MFKKFLLLCASMIMFVSCSMLQVNERTYSILNHWEVYRGEDTVLHINQDFLNKIKVGNAIEGTDLIFYDGVVTDDARFVFIFVGPTEGINHMAMGEIFDIGPDGKPRYTLEIARCSKELMEQIITNVKKYNSNEFRIERKDQYERIFYSKRSYQRYECSCKSL